MTRSALRAAKHGLTSLLGAVGFPRLAFHRAGPHYIGILVYHQVNDNPSPGSVAVSIANFDAQMKLLRDRFDVRKVHDIVSSLARGEKLPRMVMAVTFDDGYSNVAAHAYPILQRHQIPASIYLVSGLIGTDQMMWTEKVDRLVHRIPGEKVKLTCGDKIYSWPLGSDEGKRQTLASIKRLIMRSTQVEASQCMEQLAGQTGTSLGDLREDHLMMTWHEARAMDPDLVEIGSHTVTHPVMTSLTRDEVMKELVASKSKIELELGRTVHGFTYPNDIHAPWMRDCLVEAGYSYACHVGGRSLAWPVDPMALTRIHIEDWGKNSFFTEISPIGGAIRALRG